MKKEPKVLPCDAWDEMQPVVILSQCPTCGHREVKEATSGLMHPVDRTRMREVVLSLDDARFLVSSFKRGL